MRMIDAEELIKTIKDHHYLLRHPTLNSTDYGMFTNGIIQAIEEQTTDNEGGASYSLNFYVNDYCSYFEMNCQNS